jgi:polyisoprenoid-binding protein YceI
MEKPFPENRSVQGWQTCLPVLLFPLLILSGCQAIAPPRTPAAAVAQAKAGAAIPADTTRFVVDAQASEIRLPVYRAGPLARFGHNHVIRGRVRGEIRVAERAADSGFRLEIPVESFSVDAAVARAEEGEEFADEVSEQARRATRENMIGNDVLDAQRSPLIEIISVALAGPRWNPTVLARVKLRGVASELRFPAAVFRQGDLLTVVASFQIRQSDFGLTPFSTLGGGLRVRDAVDVRIRLVARRAG